MKPEPRAAVAADELAALMQRYGDGDGAAFDALYARVAPRLLGYLVRLVGERATAEDLLQQTMLKVHEARAVYVRGADPLPWLYTIAHRTFLDEVRRRGRARVGLTDDGVMAPSIEPRADLSGGREEEGRSGPGGDGAADGKAAIAALAQLPRNQREALVLTKLEGRSTAEAAAIAGTTQGAIKLRAHRAYVTLRKLLEGGAK